MADFFQEYFINPIVDQAHYPPYNVYNTITFALVALIAVFLIYKGLKKAGFTLDGTFFEAILPYVIFGGIFRVFEDAGIAPRIVTIVGYQTYPFVTPLIYVNIFLLLALTAAGAWLWTKNRSRTVTAVRNAGLLYAALALLVLLPRVKNPIWLVAGLLLALMVWGAYRWSLTFRKLPTDRMLSWMVFGQALDGSATFIGLQFAGYAEQHVVGNVLIDIGGPALFWLVKVAFAFAASEVLRGEKDDGARNFVALLITIFGLAPGLRDLVRAALGV
ncbi:DUF63 family protein [Candidatus Micrarchaeota archaeon]|nr:DUF63 family protein [Candidatus Micrarchaeota archaeon]